MFVSSPDWMKYLYFLTNIFVEFSKFFNVIIDSYSSERWCFQYYLPVVIFKHLKLKTKQKKKTAML